MKDNDAKSLEKLYESIVLLEMAHVVFDLNGQTHQFDMRIEDNQNNWNGLIQHFSDFLNQFGKYRNAAKKQIETELLQHPAIKNGVLDIYFGKTLKDYIQETK